MTQSTRNGLGQNRRGGMAEGVTSPRRQESVEIEYESSTINLDEERAAAAVAGLDFDDDGNDIDVETLGMTKDRQKEIEGSLFRMLGQNESPDKGASDSVPLTSKTRSTDEDDSSDEEDNILVNTS